MNPGFLYAAAAYGVWGLFPLYFHALQEIAPVEVVLYRVVWALGFLVLILLVRRQWRWLALLRGQPRVWLSFFGSALFLSINWLTYVWTVHAGQVADAALGYFINPLFTVVLGFFILHERLRRVQWLAVAIAAAGVAWLAWHRGQFPWVPLILAVSFGSYGLLRKTASLGALEGLTLETFLMLPAALVGLWWFAGNPVATFPDATLGAKILVAGAGPLTAIPLLLFAAGARRISLSALGFMQYATPSIQLLLAVWIFHEPFGSVQALGFALIWLALGLYSVEGLWQSWRLRARRRSQAVKPLA